MDPVRKFFFFLFFFSFLFYAGCCRSVDEDLNGWNRANRANRATYEYTHPPYYGPKTNRKQKKSIRGTMFIVLGSCNHLLLKAPETNPKSRRSSRVG